MNIAFNKQVSPTIFDFKEILQKEGFKTSWKDPFFIWLNKGRHEHGEPEQGLNSSLYILDPPIPKLTPFDYAAAEIRFNGQIYFCLSIYYCHVLENLTEADEFNQIFDQHATSWSLAIADYFYDLSSQYSLNWQSEYDSYIEDMLIGRFPFEEMDRVVSLIRKIWIKN